MVAVGQVSPVINQTLGAGQRDFRAVDWLGMVNDQDDGHDDSHGKDHYGGQAPGSG